MKRFFTILLIGTSACAYALTPSDSLYLDSIARLFNLQEVEVIARQEKDVMPPQKLSGSQLQALSTTSVADAVRYFSGVQLKDYGGVGGMKTVDVRSMGSQHLGVFYDGIEIGNAQNGTVDLGKFSMDNLEEISLYNGQKSEIFQPAKDFGSAGTLYLKTRRPKFTSGKPYNVQVKMRAGTFGLANPSLLYEQRLTENIHLSLSTEYTYATGRYHYTYEKRLANGTLAWDTTAIRQNGDVQAFRAEAGLFGYTKTGKWHAKGYYYQTERGIPGAIVNNVWKNSQRQWDRNAFVQGHYDTSLGKHFDLQLNAKYSNDHLRYLNPDTTLQWIDNTFLQQEVYASVASRCRIFPFWDVALAADYQLNWLNSNMANFAAPLRHTILLSAATAVSYKWVKFQASLLETIVADTLREHATTYSPQRAATYHQLTPAAFFNAKPILSEEWYLRAFYKMVYRMPTFNDLYYADLGSSDLKPEKTQQLDFGTEWTHTWNRLTFGTKGDVYFNKIINKIVAIPKGNSQYRWQMMNLGLVHIHGAEIAADLEYSFLQGSASKRSATPSTRALRTHAAYTFQQALDRTSPADNDPIFGTYGRQIAYIPRHSMSATATFLWDGLQLAYSFVYVGKRYTSSANIPENLVQPWYTHDLTGSYIWTLRNCRLQAGIEINNIFNQQYEVIPNYPMPGINGKGILTLYL